MVESVAVEKNANKPKHDLSETFCYTRNKIETNKCKKKH